MKLFQIKDMIKGWFIGDFDQSVYKTKDVEVGLKEYLAGAYEPAHHHNVATEFTVIVDGIVEMSGKQFSKGDIIKIDPGVSTDFKALTNVITLIVKIPSVLNDKYLD